MSPIRKAMQAARLTVPAKAAGRDIYDLAAAHIGTLVQPTLVARDPVAVLLDAAQDAGWGRQEAAAAFVRLYQLLPARLGEDGITATVNGMAVSDAYDKGDLPALLQHLTAGTSERLKSHYAQLAHLVRVTLDAVEIAGPWQEAA
jgi:hypothetical protein